MVLLGLVYLGCCATGWVDSGKRHNSGRPAVLSKRARTGVIRGLLRGESAKRIGASLGVAAATVLAVAREEGLGFYTCATAPPLTTAHKKTRLAFAKEHLRRHTNWKTVTSP